MPGIKLLSLNTEGDKHLQPQKEFFIKEGADVICLQEVFEHTFEELKDLLQMQGVFAPVWRGSSSQDVDQESYLPLGVAILSRCPIVTSSIRYYNGSPLQLKDFHPGITTQNEICRALVVASIYLNDRLYVVGTTHFTWSAHGKVSSTQRTHMNRLLTILDEFSEIILCGDMNAPRGGEIFSMLSEKYTDNIPKNYLTSIDPQLHYAGNISVMVDGLFTTDHYTAQNVELVSGLSDHCAISASII